MYKRDFETILNRLETKAKIPIDRLKKGSEVTFVEKRLAEFVGQSIRFHLRKLFNPPVLPYTRADSSGENTSTMPKPSSLEDPSMRQSRLHELVKLEVPQCARDSAVADGSISSIISTALSNIYNFFGLDGFLSAITTDDPIRVPDNFCTSPASQKGLGTSKKPTAPMTKDELSEITKEINQVYDFFAAYNACKFLVHLMKIPGVKEEISAMGGWSTVEQYSRVLRRFGLGTIFLEDAHLAVLGHAGSMQCFFAKIEDWLSYMEPKVPLAEIGINQLAKRYRTRTTSPKQIRAIYRKFPHVKVIGTAIADGMRRANVFPIVSPA